MTLERTVCYGTCPSYTVTVRGDGSVNYQGERFVAVEGARHRQIAQSAVIELLRQYYVLDFFSLRSAYVEGRDITVQTDGTVRETRAYVTDLPTVFVTLQLGSYTKRVQAYFQAPDAIYTLAKAIDDTAGTAEWVKQP